MADLSEFEQNHRTIAAEKMMVDFDHLTFVGHYVDSVGITPIVEKIRTIYHIELPKSVTQIRSFMGKINFYCRSMRNRVELAKPLYNFIKNKFFSRIQYGA